jgi:hypothetical protein
LVIDWRAPMSARSTGPPGRADGRAQAPPLGFSSGLLTSYEDEPLGAADGAEVDAAESRSCWPRSSGPGSGPMRDIVATIQPDQDDLVRPGLDDSICVQGAPAPARRGGLHRAAYLLYT